MSWNLTGTYFETCNCEAACPCIFLSDPTNGDCTALIGWHIEEGEFEGISVADLNVGLAVYAGGNMATTDWSVALYLDDRANEAQANALGAMFSGAAGGHPAVLAGHIKEVLGVKSAAITYDTTETSLTFSIGDTAVVAMTAIGGQGGAQVKINNHPLAVTPGNELTVNRAETFTFADHGYDWRLSGKSGFTSAFQYEG